MQAGTGIAELIALEISKKVSNMFVLIFSVKLLVFLDGVSFIFF